MELKEITVKRIKPEALPRQFYFQLIYVYRTDLSQFVVMYDEREHVLYINDAVSKEDADMFLECASFVEPYINDPDGPMEAKLDYICDAYGSSTYLILMAAYNSRQKIIREIKAKKKAEEVLPKVAAARSSDDLPVCFDEELVYQINAAAREIGRKTNNNLVDYGTEYTFWLGYLIGTGEIRLEE